MRIAGTVHRTGKRPVPCAHDRPTRPRPARRARLPATARARGRRPRLALVRGRPRAQAHGRPADELRPAPPALRGRGHQGRRRRLPVHHLPAWPTTSRSGGRTSSSSTGPTARAPSGSPSATRRCGARASAPTPSRPSMDFAFGELRMERLWLDTDAHNERAQAVYRKAGFSVEGIAPPRLVPGRPLHRRHPHGHPARRVAGPPPPQVVGAPAADLSAGRGQSRDAPPRTDRAPGARPSGRTAPRTDAGRRRRRGSGRRPPRARGRGCRRRPGLAPSARRVIAALLRADRRAAHDRVAVVGAAPA